MLQNLVFEFIHTPAIFYRHKIKLTPEQYGLKRWSRSLTRG
jgi:hypothetical protein